MTELSMNIIYIYIYPHIKIKLCRSIVVFKYVESTHALNLYLSKLYYISRLFGCYIYIYIYIS